jgi:simple sugar transport system ATP-binding protein
VSAPGQRSTDAEAGATAVAPAIRLRGITKRFPGVVANEDVDFEAAVGEVHALLGENGAGKSTLSNVMTGLYLPDEGTMEVHGRHVAFRSPRDAIAVGIGMVHQHFRLVPTLTVAENVVLGDASELGRRLVRPVRAIEAEVAALADRYGLPVEPRARIWQLSVGEQQRVEILKALYRDANILILDEPTAVLTPQESDLLVGTIRRMAADGRTVIFISHKLHEVAAVANRVTVLRGGRAVGTVDAAGATRESLAALMVGREIATGRVGAEGHAIGGVVLAVRDLRCDGDRGTPAVRGVDLEVRAGEILAVAGVAGNGQRELAEAITGLRRARGEVTVDGRRVRLGGPRSAIDLGISYVPEDRLRTGVAPSLSIAQNVALKTYRAHGLLLRPGRLRRAARELIERYDVRAPGPDTPCRQLSGGNLQKVVLGREFGGAPRVLVAASPTRGLDVGAIETVHGYLREAAGRGVAVLLLSEDLDEVLALADRVAVMFEGRIAGIRDGASAEPRDLGLLMAGGAAA